MEPKPRAISLAVALVVGVSSACSDMGKPVELQPVAPAGICTEGVDVLDHGVRAYEEVNSLFRIGSRAVKLENDEETGEKGVVVTWQTTGVGIGFDGKLKTTSTNHRQPLQWGRVFTWEEVEQTQRNEKRQYRVTAYPPEPKDMEGKIRVGYEITCIPQATP